jgi:hypothetical protein
MRAAEKTTKEKSEQLGKADIEKTRYYPQFTNSYRTSTRLHIYYIVLQASMFHLTSHYPIVFVQVMHLYHNEHENQAW